MSDPSSLFAKIGMSKGASDKWLKSPVRNVDEYDDWRQMNPTLATHYDDWKDTFGKFEYMSVEEFLDAASHNSKYFCCDYDDDMNAFCIADACHAANMQEITIAIAALRGAETFKDNNNPSFIYVFPALSGGDPEALLQIQKGSSHFLMPNDSSPDVLYFVNEADEFIETLLEDDD